MNIFLLNFHYHPPPHPSITTTKCITEKFSKKVQFKILFGDAAYIRREHLDINFSLF